MFFLFFSLVLCSNHVLLLSTSRSWLNFRHFFNVKLVHDYAVDHAFLSTHITVAVADEYFFNPRHIKPVNSYFKIDHSGDSVTLDLFDSLLDTFVSSYTNSSLLLYLTGHGGNEFLKFQDHNHLSSSRFANTVTRLLDRKVFSHVLIVLDTCQASTLFSKLDKSLPNLSWIASSSINEDSISTEYDSTMGVFLQDRFTSEFIKLLRKRPNTLISDIPKLLSRRLIGSTVVVHYSKDFVLNKFFSYLLSLKIQFSHIHR
ncbi:hypothetical protein RCL1_006067 [Eukaryota sp. TZLM3-RCL]